MRKDVMMMSVSFLGSLFSRIRLSGSLCVCISDTWTYIKDYHIDLADFCCTGICQNVEGMMKMYSEELKILDRNTVKYMVDQMQEQIDSQKEQLAEKEREIQELKRKLAEQK